MPISSRPSSPGRRRFLQAVPALTFAAAPGFVDGFANRFADGPLHLPAGSITDVPHVRAGNFTHPSRPTGCTVLIFDGGAVVGVDVRGSAPGTRETDLLNPINTVQQANAILLSGGSAFGLDAASGVMRFLDEHNIGFPVGNLHVPIVPAAVLYDLSVGDGRIRPNADSGYQACQSATNAPLALGNVGAGAGATVGKIFGISSAMKGGLGSASLKVPGTDLVVGAVAAVNAVGDIYDSQTGRLLAGARTPDGKALRNSMTQILNGATIKSLFGANSTISIVATNAALTKTEATKMAQMAHDGYARSINPVHTAYDGDTIFAAATGTSTVKVDTLTIGALGAECIARAIKSGVLNAQSISGYPSASDLR